MGPQVRFCERLGGAIPAPTRPEAAQRIANSAGVRPPSEPCGIGKYAITYDAALAATDRRSGGCAGTQRWFATFDQCDWWPRVETGF